MNPEVLTGLNQEVTEATRVEMHAARDTFFASRRRARNTVSWFSAHVASLITLGRTPNPDSLINTTGERYDVLSKQYAAQRGILATQDARVEGGEEYSNLVADTAGQVIAQERVDSQRTEVAQNDVFGTLDRLYQRMYSVPGRRFIQGLGLAIAGLPVISDLNPNSNLGEALRIMGPVATALAFDGAAHWTLNLIDSLRTRTTRGLRYADTFETTRRLAAYHEDAVLTGRVGIRPEEQSLGESEQQARTAAIRWELNRPGLEEPEVMESLPEGFIITDRRYLESRRVRESQLNARNAELATRNLTLRARELTAGFGNNRYVEYLNNSLRRDRNHRILRWAGAIALATLLSSNWQRPIEAEYDVINFTGYDVVMEQYGNRDVSSLKGLAEGWVANYKFNWRLNFGHDFDPTNPQDKQQLERLWEIDPAANDALRDVYTREVQELNSGIPNLITGDWAQHNQDIRIPSEKQLKALAQHTP